MLQKYNKAKKGSEILQSRCVGYRLGCKEGTLPEQVQPRSFLEGVSSGRENSWCKGPEAGVCLEGQRITKETSMAGIERRGRAVIRDKVGGVPGARCRRASRIQERFGPLLRLLRWLSGRESPAMRETWRTWVQPLGREGPLEEEMVTRSSTLAWKTPWTEEPGRLQSRGVTESQTCLSH